MCNAGSSSLGSCVNRITAVLQFGSELAKAMSGKSLDISTLANLSLLAKQEHQIASKILISSYLMMINSLYHLPLPVFQGQ